jgi:hypothetical protein
MPLQLCFKNSCAAPLLNQSAECGSGGAAAANRCARVCFLRSALVPPGVVQAPARASRMNLGTTLECNFSAARPCQPKLITTGKRVSPGAQCGKRRGQATRVRSVRALQGSAQERESGSDELGATPQCAHTAGVPSMVFSVLNMLIEEGVGQLGCAQERDCCCTASLCQHAPMPRRTHALHMH